MTRTSTPPVTTAESRDTGSCKDPDRGRHRSQVVPAQGKGGLEEQWRQEERKHDAGGQRRECVESERIRRHDNPDDNQTDGVRNPDALYHHCDQTGRNQQEENDG